MKQAYVVYNEKKNVVTVVSTLKRAKLECEMIFNKSNIPFKWDNRVCCSHIGFLNSSNDSDFTASYELFDIKKSK